MQLDALMGNDISVISHFTFSHSAPEPSLQQNLFHRRKRNKTNPINSVADCIADRIMQ